MDLEAYALRRDRRFLWRLVLMLAIGLLASLWIFGKLTGDDVGSCAARGFGSLSGTAPTPETVRGAHTQ